MEGPGIRTDDDGRIVGYRFTLPAPSLPTYQEAAAISALEDRACVMLRTSYLVAAAYGQGSGTSIRVVSGPR